jgi:hypothetical protein
MTTAEVLDRASEIVREDPFDMSSFATCAASALYHAAGKRGLVDEPTGAYAEVLAHVVQTAGAPSGDGSGHDLIDALHHGVWDVQRHENWSAQKATLSMFAAARDACAEPVRELAMA